MSEKRKVPDPESGGKQRKICKRDKVILESLTFAPKHYIRAHSKTKKVDDKTQVWDVVFEPDPDDASKTTSNVATCGGNSISVIDVNSGTVCMKYEHQDKQEVFYTLAWTTLLFENRRSNILLSGSISGEIRMFHPEKQVCFRHFRVMELRNIPVNSILFHSEKPTWLFCGTEDGMITLWDIGPTTLLQYDVSPTSLLKLFPGFGAVYNIAWTGKNGWLLAGCAAGLVGYQIEDKKVETMEDYAPCRVAFFQPKSKKDDGQNPIVDSLVVASEWTIVSKCALHGLIYVWDLKATVNSLNKFNMQAKDDVKRNIINMIESVIEEILDKVVEPKAANNLLDKVNEVEDNDNVEDNITATNVVMLANLKWSNTDNLFMNLGCHKGKGLIACGDDRGTIWVYNLPQFGKDGGKPIKGKVEPMTKLEWPDLQDDRQNNNSPKGQIIMDKVVVSHDNMHIVGVTSNNLVCIWRQM